MGIFYFCDLVTQPNQAAKAAKQFTEIVLRLFYAHTPHPSDPHATSTILRRRRSRSCHTGAERKSTSMKARHPLCKNKSGKTIRAARGAGHGYSLQFPPRRKACGRVFRTGAEFTPTGVAGCTKCTSSVIRLGPATISAGLCGRGFPAGAVRSGTFSHRCIGTDAELY